MAASMGLVLRSRRGGHQCLAGQPRSRAPGLAQGDVIQTVDGEPIDDERALTFAVGARRPGETVSIVLARGRQTRTVRVPLDRLPTARSPDPRLIQGRNPLAGATVANLSPAEAYRRRLDPFVSRGVVVTRMQPGFSQMVGIQVGDIVRRGERARDQQLSSAPSRSCRPGLRAGR